MATYYVSAATGDDGDTGLTEALAWLTIDHAMNIVAAGDKVYVKADGNYTELATIDTVGTTTAPIVFEGYTTTPGDGGKATITGSGSRANCVDSSVGAGTAVYYVFKNLIFTAATAAGVLSTNPHLTFKNCQFTSNGTSGLACRLVGCEGCAFTSNTQHGVVFSGGGGIFVGCTFYSNTLDGIHSSDYPVVACDCVFFSNAGDNINAGGSNQLQVVLNCTMDGDSKDSTTGVAFAEITGMCAVVNTVLYDCATGLSMAGGNAGERVISRNNLVNANTADYSNAATFTGEVTDAPAFVNEVGGADYHPDTGSPLRDAGFDGGASMDIGAVQSVAGVASNVFKLRIGV